MPIQEDQSRRALQEQTGTNLTVAEHFHIISSLCSGFEVKELEKLNHSISKSELTEGTTIVLPAGALSNRDKEIISGIGWRYRTYPVRKGEKIEDITSKRGISMTEMEKLNPDVDLQKLKRIFWKANGMWCHMNVLSLVLFGVKTREHSTFSCLPTSYVFLLLFIAFFDTYCLFCKRLHRMLWSSSIFSRDVALLEAIEHHCCTTHCHCCF